jgi:N-acyl-D-amino-acid deacylase
MFDLLLKGARVVDGTGNPWFTADVGIRGGRIVAVGSLAGSEAVRELDLTGMVLAPGFVDIHSHSDFILPLPNHIDILEPLLAQGITTVVNGNCGLSPAPLEPANCRLLKGYTAFCQGGDLAWDWVSMGDFLDRLEESGIAINALQLASHGAIRIAVMGFDSSEPDQAQLAEMQRLVAQSMEEGAFGLSAGLIYAPGMYASTEELIAVSKPLIPYRGVFTCHVRGSSETGLESTKEIIEIARANGIPVEHSHIEEFGEPYWPRIDEVIALHDAARAEGLDVTFDVIPYTTANTTLTACFPPYAFDGGLDRFIERLQVPAQREKLRFDVEHMVSEWPTWRPGAWPHNLVRATGWGNIRLMWAGGERNAAFIGRSMAEIGEALGKTPFDAVADMLVEENGAVLALYVGVSGDLDRDEGLLKFLRHPNGAINTDAILTGRGMPHQAAFGAFPRVLGEFVRERRLLSLEDAVRKMTSLSLRRFGVQDRGLIREGMWADITVFDPDTVADNSTHLDPARKPSGIEYVLVNGRMMVEDGRIDRSGRPGRVVRRSG